MNLEQAWLLEAMRHWFRRHAFYLGGLREDQMLHRVTFVLRALRSRPDAPDRAILIRVEFL